eukprot:Ihof_evm2s716 gene=Ihof_evmTU2s716
MVTSTALILLGDTPTYLEVDSAPTGRTSRNTGSQASKVSLSPLIWNQLEESMYIEYPFCNVMGSIHEWHLGFKTLFESFIRYDRDSLCNFGGGGARLWCPVSEGELSSLVVGGWMVIQTKAEDAALLLHVHKAVEDMLMCSVASPTHGYREPHTDSIVSSLAGLIHRSETGESLPSSPIANTMSLYTSRYLPLIPTASHISSTGKASLLLYRPPALRSSSYGSLP